MFSVNIALVVLFKCQRNPVLGPAGASSSFKEKMKSLSGTIEIIILFVAVIGGLFAGIFTPTEGGAIGAAGALIIAVIRKNMSWKNFVLSLKDTAPLVCMIFVVLAGATIFGHFLAVTEVPMTLAAWIGGLTLHPYVIMLIILLIYLIGGCFVDGIALIMLTLPIFFPIVTSLGFDPIWFGVIIILISDMGLMTPPVGVVAYVISGVSELPLETVFRGIYPFLLALIAGTLLLIFFPDIVLFFPNLMS
jgi:tripartite ATP-independent transporter DctM subunit